MVRAHGFEFKPGNALGGMAGQDLAGRRDVEELPAPAAHAFLRPQRVVVRDHIVDRERALKPRLRFLDDATRLLELLECRHQRGAVLQCPAVILHVGDFQPVGVEIDRHLDDLRQLVQILSVHDGIHRERQIEFARPFRDFELLGMRALETGDTVGADGLVTLKTDLHVGQSRVGERGELLRA